MSAMLKEQLVIVFSLMTPGMLFQYEPELDAFLEFLIWRLVWVDKPTPGNALMNLRYRDEHAVELRGKVRTGLGGPGLTVAQKMWCGIAAVGGHYIWARLQSFTAFRRWGDSEQAICMASLSLMQHIEGLHKAGSFGNVLIYLYTGRKCCCCFSLFLTRQLLKVFFSLSRRTNLQVLQRMIQFVPFAGQVQHLLISHSLVSSGIATTALEHDVLRLPGSGVPIAGSLLLCSSIAVLLTMELTVYKLRRKRECVISHLYNRNAQWSIQTI